MSLLYTQFRLIPHMEKFRDMDLQAFKRAFQLFDKDNSGSISREEISTVFKELNIRLSGDEVEKIMDNFDANHDDSIQFEEFLLVLQAHMEEPECEAWMFEVFQIIDQDGDGLIGKEQLLLISTSYGLEISQKEVDLIMEEGDPSEEGGINYEEFSRILKAVE